MSDNTDREAATRYRPIMDANGDAGMVLCEIGFWVTIDDYRDILAAKDQAEAENKALRDERGVTPEAIERAAYAIAEVVAARRCEGIPAVQDQRRAEAKAALEAATLSPAPVSDAEPMHDDAPAAIIGEIGNQIHNLGCEYQNNEELGERLSDLASRTWKAARMVSTKAPERDD